MTPVKAELKRNGEECYGGNVTAVAEYVDAHFATRLLYVRFVDGRRLYVPLTWFPRLAKATPEQLENFRLSGGGTVIHWPQLDEAVFVDGLLHATRAPDSP